MYRAAKERPLALRKWKAHNKLVHLGKKTGCICDEQPNRFRKTDRIAGRCGNRHCWMCYGIGDEKRMGIPTHNQIKETMSYKEQLQDLEYSPVIPPRFDSLRSM